MNSPWYKLVLAALLVYATLFVSARKDSGDFPVYYQAAQRLRAGDDLYTVVPNEVFSYPPLPPLFACR
jgi:hypothetical protein